jgi:hypothetical protein
MNAITIDLELYRTPGARVYTGRDRGKDVREKSRIDELEVEVDKIIISVPEDVYSVNPSFLEEFLENVVTKLGRIGFYQKFNFETKGAYKIDEDLSAAVDRILRTRNALI